MTTANDIAALNQISAYLSNVNLAAANLNSDAVITPTVAQVLDIQNAYNAIFPPGINPGAYATVTIPLIIANMKNGTTSDGSSGTTPTSNTGLYVGAGLAVGVGALALIWRHNHQKTTKQLRR